MSRPTEQQVRQLLLRVQNQLEEWDDVEFALCVIMKDGSMCHLHKIGLESGARVSRNVLNVVLDQIDDYINRSDEEICAD